MRALVMTVARATVCSGGGFFQGSWIRWSVDAPFFRALHGAFEALTGYEPVLAEHYQQDDRTNQDEQRIPSRSHGQSFLLLQQRFSKQDEYFIN
jgi:hypothetical protein